MEIRDLRNHNHRIKIKTFLSKKTNVYEKGRSSGHGLKEKPDLNGEGKWNEQWNDPRKG
jgi:hypothetical protein